MLTIRLLGSPTVQRDGGAAIRLSPEAWALLCHLLLSERPQLRKHVATLLFGDTTDPLLALEWTLAELRRGLGAPDAFSGDPVTTALGEALLVDVHLLTGSDEFLLDVDGELLGGIDFSARPEFELWLLIERHRLAATLETRLRQAVVARLADGRAAEAVSYGSRLVALNPLDEGNHVLLVRSLSMAGEHAAALRQVALCEDILRSELDLEASPALRAAATAGSAPLR